MKARPVVLSLLFVAAGSAGAHPPLPPARHGDHPAVVVQRLQAQAGYDYASKFYLHPAGYALAAESARDMGQHPAVLAWQRDREERLPLRVELEDRLRDPRGTVSH